MLSKEGTQARRAGAAAASSQRLVDCRNTVAAAATPTPAAATAAPTAAAATAAPTAARPPRKDIHDRLLERRGVATASAKSRCAPPGQKLSCRASLPDHSHQPQHRRGRQLQDIRDLIAKGVNAIVFNRTIPRPSTRLSPRLMRPVS